MGLWDLLRSNQKSNELPDIVRNILELLDIFQDLLDVAVCSVDSFVPGHRSKQHRQLYVKVVRSCSLWCRKSVAGQRCSQLSNSLLQILLCPML